METSNRYYTPYTYRQVGESYFPSTEPDYKQVQNLIAGKGQAIIAYGSMKDVDIRRLIEESFALTAPKTRIPRIQKSMHHPPKR